MPFISCDASQRSSCLKKTVRPQFWVEMAEWAPGIFGFFLQESLHAPKFLVLAGGILWLELPDEAEVKMRQQ